MQNPLTPELSCFFFCHPSSHEAVSCSKLEDNAPTSSPEQEATYRHAKNMAEDWFSDSSFSMMVFTIFKIIRNICKNGFLSRLSPERGEKRKKARLHLQICLSASTHITSRNHYGFFYIYVLLLYRLLLQGRITD